MNNFNPELHYWKRRCFLAEQFIEKSPCDPDITEEQSKAYWSWRNYLKDCEGRVDEIFDHK